MFLIKARMLSHHFHMIMQLTSLLISDWYSQYLNMAGYESVMRFESFEYIAINRYKIILIFVI